MLKQGLIDILVERRAVKKGAVFAGRFKESIHDLLKETFLEEVRQNGLMNYQTYLKKKEKFYPLVNNNTKKASLKPNKNLFYNKI